MCYSESEQLESTATSKYLPKMLQTLTLVLKEGYCTQMGLFS